MHGDEGLGAVRLVAVSPGDVLAERETLQSVVSELNRRIATPLGRTLLLWRWELDSGPGLHRHGPQGLIDERMAIEDADVVIGIFWRRFGTPAMEAGSGTEHELRKAWSAWQKNGTPEVFLYFCDRPASPGSAEELDQWKRVLEFRNALPQEQSWWGYTAVADFERLVREHLTDFLMRRYGQGQPESASSGVVTGALDAPRFAGSVRRTALLTELDALARTNPVVLVEGLPGSGKTYAVASYIAETGMAGSSPWFDPHESATLDDLIVLLSGRLGFSGISAAAKARELIRYLRERSLVLVIDDYHRVDTGSFAPLLAQACESPGPAALIVASRTYVDSPVSGADVGRLSIPGLEVSEAREMLARRGTRLGDRQVESLARKVDGLPIAIDVFSSLVVEFGRNPADLLAGSMVASQRFQDWFAELRSVISPEARRMLGFLSVATVPFNIGLVRAGGRRWAQADGEMALEELQRAYLVQTYSPYRWTVHHLISALARAELSSEEVRAVHSIYAQYYVTGWRPGLRVNPDDDKAFARLASGCRHLLAAGRYDEADSLLEAMAPAAKAGGRYEAFVELCRGELDRDGVDPWLHYHVAHCALIIGYFDEARRALDDVISIGDLSPDLHLSAARLDAELLEADGSSEEALEIIQAALKASAEQARPRVRAHARQVEGQLLARMGNTTAATGIALEQLADADHRRDKRGAAIALTQLGYLDLARDADGDAVLRFVQATELFREAHDRRGTSWSLMGSAEAHLAASRFEAVVEALNEALQIRGEIGEISEEYRDTLKRLQAGLPDPSRCPALDAEIRRLDAALEG